MHLLAALERWARSHQKHFSPSTLSELRTIGEAIATSPVAEANVREIDDEVLEQLDVLFEEPRRGRAREVVAISSAWAIDQADKRAAQRAKEQLAKEQHAQEQLAQEQQAKEEAEALVAERAAAERQAKERAAAKQAEEREAKERAEQAAEQRQDHERRAKEEAEALTKDETASAAPIEAPAFLRSDRVDQDDDERIYGPKWPWKGMLAGLASLAALAAIGFGGWYLFNQRDAVTASEPAEVAAVDPAPETPVALATPTAETIELPTAVPDETQSAKSPFWADIGPILNSGSGTVQASTYAVSGSNRAVLTGHTDAVTGVIVADDGRVLTSGADKHFVDWGSEIAIEQPGSLSSPSPVTVLARTVDQRLLAGDSAGNLTIIDLINEVDPLVISIHPAPISAVAELADGRIAVASVDGAVAIFAPESPTEQTVLAHDHEVTGLVALADGRVATSAVDGIVRLWNLAGQANENETDETAELAPELIDNASAPLTALALLADGQLVAGTIDGEIIVLPADQGAAPVRVIAAHAGPIRALQQVTLPEGGIALASAGDDTTIRLWDLGTGVQLRVLEGHGDIVSDVDQLPDGRIISTSGDATGRVWDLTVAPNHDVMPPHNASLSAVAPWSGDQFISGAVDGSVVLASTSTTSQPVAITQHAAPVVGVGTLPRGEIVSLDSASVLRVSQPDGDPAAMVESVLASGATALHIIGAEGVVTGHADGSVRINDFATETLVVDVHQGSVSDVVMLSSGFIVSAGQDRSMYVIDPADSTKQVVDLHSEPVDVVIELSDGRVASSGADGIYVWSTGDRGAESIRLNGHRSVTLTLAEMPDGRLVSTAEDGRVRIWDLTNPSADPITLIDIPGIKNPHLAIVDNGLMVAGAARGYVVFPPQ